MISHFCIFDKILNGNVLDDVSKWKSSGFSFIPGTIAFTIESLNCLCSSILSLVNIGASRIQTKMNEYGDFLVPETQP